MHKCILSTLILSLQITSLYCYNSCVTSCLVCDPCFSKSGSAYDDPYGDVYIYGDVLYWHLCRSNLDLAIQADTTETPSLIVGTGPVLYSDKDSEFGFRLGIGTRTFYGVDYALRYTYFRGESQDPIDLTDPLRSGATRLPPTSSPDFGPNNVIYIDPFYKLTLKSIDVEAGFIKKMNCRTFIRPFIAFRTIWVDEDVQDYYADDFLAPKTSQQYYAEMQTKGYGANGGFDFNFVIHPCLSITGRSSIAALLGEQNSTTSVESDININPDPTILLYVENDRAYRTLITTDVSIGLTAGLFSICCTQINASLGYELHTIHGIPDFQDFPSSEVTSKLMRDTATVLLHGLYGRLEAAF